MASQAPARSVSIKPAFARASAGVVLTREFPSESALSGTAQENASRPDFTHSSSKGARSFEGSTSLRREPIICASSLRRPTHRAVGFVSALQGCRPRAQANATPRAFSPRRLEANEGVRLAAQKVALPGGFPDRQVCGFLDSRGFRPTSWASGFRIPRCLDSSGFL